MIPCQEDKACQASSSIPSSIVTAKSTIGAGASAVPVHGHQISWNSAVSNVVVDGQAHPLFLPESSSSLPVNNKPASTLFATTVDGHKIRAAPSPGVMLIDGQSVTWGKSPILVSSTWVALHSDRDLVIGTSTLQSFLTSLPNSAQILAAAGQPTTVLSNGVVVAGSIMTANAEAVTVAGTLSSLGSNILVEGASTIPISTPALAASVTAAGQAVTVLANGDVIISSTTLAPVDPVITIAGTPISLGPISLGPQGRSVNNSLVLLSVNIIHYNRRASISYVSGYKRNCRRRYNSPSWSASDNYLRDTSSAQTTWIGGRNVNHTLPRYCSIFDIWYWRLYRLWSQRLSYTTLQNWSSRLESDAE